MDAQTALARLAAAALLRAQSAQPLPGYHPDVLEAGDDGKAKVRFGAGRAVVDWRDALRQLRPEEAEEEAWNVLMAEVVRLTRDEPRIRDTEEVARVSLQRCLRAIQAGEASVEQAAEYAWSETLAFLSHDRVRGKIIAPLRGFDLAGRLDVSDDITIVRASIEDQQRYLDMRGYSVGRPDAELIWWLRDWNNTVIIDVEAPAYEAPNWATAEMALQSVITALRIHAPGAVKVTRYWMDVDDPIGFYGNALSTYPGGGMLTFTSLPGGSWQAWPEGHDTHSFPVTYEQYRRASGNERSFDLAVRRFNAAYERRAPEDRLIDYWVALEALFTRRQESAISYRATSRIARFIGSDKRERVTLREATKLAYDARSEVVHGTPPDRMRAKIKTKGLDAITAETEDVLRRCLRAWIDPNKSHDLQVIDNSMMA